MDYLNCFVPSNVCVLVAVTLICSTFVFVIVALLDDLFQLVMWVKKKKHRRGECCKGPKSDKPLFQIKGSKISGQDDDLQWVISLGKI